MWIIILIAITGNGIETDALQGTFPTEAVCERAADGAETVMRAMTDVADPAVFATCFQIPQGA